MANLNKDYLVIADLKNAKVQAPAMESYNTDKRIFNIFLKLQITMSDNPDIKVYVTNENATNYSPKLTVVKPKTNQIREINGELMNVGTVGDGAIYQFDLPKEFTDQVGVYKCELTVTCDVDEFEEMITCSPFSYNIKSSILTGLNPEIESNPDLPILEQLIEDVKSLEGVSRTDLVVSGNVANMNDNSIQNVKLSNNSIINLPLVKNDKQITLNVKTSSSDLILTFKSGTHNKKIKLAGNSYNVFQINVNGNDYIIERKSNIYPTLTPEEERNDIDL